jgi:CxxC motif-containing protein (DUF1111 family)
MRTVLSVRVFVSATTTLAALVILAPTMWSATGPTEAKTGFTLSSNGFAEEYCGINGADQRRLSDSPLPLIDGDECNFETAAEEFTGPETAADGLGPIFNAAGCGECHMMPILGGSIQVVERRAGKFDGNAFFDPPGGSLIQDRALDPRIQEVSDPKHSNVQALRASLSVLGLGFVEAINSNTLDDIKDAQPSSMRGRLIDVSVQEAPGRNRAGRFGWKDQQASLLSFSADAYVNEMGITSPLEPVEPTSMGNSIAAYDKVPGPPQRATDPDDDGVDVELFALFMRSTLAPPVDAQRAGTSDAQEGSRIFNNLKCDVCHTRSITTAAPGTVINGGALKVANALGNKVIHPFSDFLLHDIGTGDGIVQNGGGNTRNTLRTVPLWGLRARGRFMHDGLSFNVTDAILRHDNQARSARDGFKGLSSRDKDRLLAFLMSL